MLKTKPQLNKQISAVVLAVVVLFSSVTPAYAQASSDVPQNLAPELLEQLKDIQAQQEGDAEETSRQTLPEKSSGGQANANNEAKPGVVGLFYKVKGFLHNTVSAVKNIFSKPAPNYITNNNQKYILNRNQYTLNNVKNETNNNYITQRAPDYKFVGENGAGVAYDSRTRTVKISAPAASATQFITLETKINQLEVNSQQLAELNSQYSNLAAQVATLQQTPSGGTTTIVTQASLQAGDHINIIDGVISAAVPTIDRGYTFGQSTAWNDTTSFNSLWFNKIGSSGDIIRAERNGAAAFVVDINGNTSVTGNLVQSGTGSLTTGTGAVSFNGPVSITGTNTLTVGTGLTTLGGNLSVGGAIGITLTGNDADITFSGTGNHDITATSGTLRIGSTTVIGTILPLDNTIDIGAPGTRFDKFYADEVNATNLVGTITGGNVSAETIRVNSDNATVDAEDSFLEFERGSVTPNALLQWDSLNDRFTFNSSLYLTSGIGTANLNVAGSGTFGANLTVTTGGASITGNSTIAGTLTGLTGLTSSGTITFSGLIPDRLVATTTGGQLATSISSANLAASVTDETGSGALVFGTSPSFAASITTGSVSFDLINTTATTVNFGGAATTLNIGPGGVSATSINLAGGSAATGCTVDGATGNIACTGNVTGANISGTITGTNTGDVTLAGENYLSLTGQQITANAVNLAGTNVTGTLTVVRGGTGTTTSTGSGSVVLSTSPSLTTPNIGAATGSSLNLGSGAITSGLINGQTISSSANFTGTVAVATSLSTPSIITASGALGITPAAGSSLNVNLSTTGDFAVNTSQLYVDTSAGYVGIGTTGPGEKLDVSGNTRLLKSGAATSLTQYPSYDFKLQGSSWDTTLNAGAGGESINNFVLRNTGLSAAGADYRLGILNNAGTEVVSIKAAGNVGIGDTSPTNKLDVTGAIGISDTTVIDASRNLVNIGTISSGAITSGLINGQTISSSANFTGTLAIATSATIAGNTVYHAGNDPLDTIAEWQTLCTNCADIVNDTTGTLTVARGGTGVTTSTGSGSVVLSSSPTITTPTINVIEMRRDSSATHGISWYAPSYTAWSTYMSPAGNTTSGPHGNITAPSGTIVTSWALRNFVENAAGYGWTWESGTSGGQPTVVAEIRSSDGAARFAGSVTASSFSGSGSGLTGTASSLTAGAANSVTFNGGLTTASSPTFAGLTLNGNLSMYNNTLNAGDVIYLGSQNTVATTAFRGINFHTAGDLNYYIGKPAGTWTQPLNIAFYTGIRIGADIAYGGTKFYNSSNMVTELFSVGNGDNHVRVANNLYIGGNLALHAGNYNSYAPTLTGGGASGTWGINITGTASNITAYTINQNVGTGNSPTFAGLTLNGNLSTTGTVTQAGYLDPAHNNLVYNGDLETGNSSGWVGINSVVTGGLSGNYAAQVTNQSASIESTDFIPVDPRYDTLQLEGWFKETVTGTTPGILYFGYIAYTAGKVAITTAPCGTYCYFAASGYNIPNDGNWHKLTATTTGEGTAYPNFPVGTRYVRVLMLMNYGAAGETSLFDHVTLRRINNGPLFVGNNFSTTNLNDQNQVTKVYTTSSNLYTIVPPSGGYENITNGDTSLTLYGPNTSWGGKLFVGASPNQGVAATAQVIATDGNLHLDPAPSKNMYLGYYQARDIYINPNGGNVGIGTTGPSAKLDIQTTATGVATIKSAVSAAGQNFLSVYGTGANYAPGITWSTSDNVPGVPKTGIWSRFTGPGSYIEMGTSNSYVTGITNTALSIDPSGNTTFGNDFTIRADDSGGSPGTPWMRSNGSYLVINPNTGSDLYLAWDTGANVYVGSNATLRLRGGVASLGGTDLEAIRGTDSWLRLNNNSSFTSGVYTPGVFRADGIYYGNGRRMFTTTDTYLRINENLDFASGIWMGSSNLLGAGNFALGSNGGTTNSRVYINGGAYNAVNVINIDGSNGNISATSYTVNGSTLINSSGRLFADTINTRSTGDPLEINYDVAGPVKVCSAASCTSYSAYFDQSSRVGINNITPSTDPLEVNGVGGSTGTGILLYTNDSALWGKTTTGTRTRLIFLGADNVTRINTPASSSIKFRAGESDMFTMDSAGNTYTSGTGEFGKVRALSATATTGQGSACYREPSMEIVYNVSSDSCLSSLRSTKRDINNLTLQGLEVIEALQPVSFVYNEGDQRVRYGFIAEDTASVDMHLTTYNNQGELTGIDDRAILSVAVKAIKELSARVAALEGELMQIRQTEATLKVIENLQINAKLTVYGEAVFKGGVWVEGKLVTADIEAKSIVTEQLKVKNPVQDKNGFVIYDRVTGEPTCVVSEGGVLKSYPGECADLPPVIALTPTVAGPAAVEPVSATPLESADSTTSPVSNGAGPETTITETTTTTPNQPTSTTESGLPDTGQAAADPTLQSSTTTTTTETTTFTDPATAPVVEEPPPAL